MKIKPSRFLIVGICMTLFLLSTSHAALSKDQLTRMLSNGHKVGFFVNFDGIKIRNSHLDIYENGNDIVGSTLDNVLKPISSDLIQHLFSPETINPFRVLFPQIYQSAQNNAYQYCDFVGIQFELDDRQDTQEWFISFPAEKCLYADNAIIQNSYSEAHSWFIQKDSQGIYKVLMQSEGLLYSIKHKNHAYRTLETQIFNQHMQRNNKKSCGYGIITWNYQNNQYIPQQLFSKINGCESVFPETGEDPRQREKNMVTLVEKLLFNTLNKLIPNKLFIDNEGKLNIISIQK